MSTKSQTIQKHQSALRKFESEWKLKKKKLKLGKQALQLLYLEQKQLIEEEHAAELLKFEKPCLDKKLDDSLEDEDSVKECVDIKGNRKMEKARRKRERKKEMETSRQEKILLEKKSIVSDRDMEMDKLKSQLEPLGFCIVEMPSDGNCMYYSFLDQIKYHEQYIDKMMDVEEVRRKIAAYMKSHREDFEGFLFLEEEEEGDVLEAYCRKLETTKVWGGEVELRALANAFQVNIQIFAANRAMLMHESKDTPMATLRLSFHEHYYALGAHYNSIH